MLDYVLDIVRKEAEGCDCMQVRNPWKQMKEICNRKSCVDEQRILLELIQ